MILIPVDRVPIGAYRARRTVEFGPAAKDVKGRCRRIGRIEPRVSNVAGIVDDQDRYAHGASDLEPVVVAPVDL